MYSPVLLREGVSLVLNVNGAVYVCSGVSPATIENVSRSLFIPVISVDVELLRCVLVNACSLFGVALVVAVRLLAYIISGCVYELILMLLFRQSSVDLCMNLC